MRLAKRLGVLSGVLGVIAPAILKAQSTTQPSQAELAREVQELQIEVQQLKSRLDAEEAAKNPPVPATASANAPGNMPAAAAPPPAQVAGAQPNYSGQPNSSASESHQPKVLEPFNDLHAGYDPDKGFILRSGDGNFLLHPWAFFQFRNATNYRTSPSDLENGFELPRAKFIFDGNVFTPNLTYQLIWATSDTTGNLQLQDAWARYHFPDTSFAVEAGQIRDPVDHEQILFATKSLTPDRSIVNNIFLNGDDIVKGAELSYGYDQDSPIRDAAALTSGERNFDTTFQDYPTNTADWGAANRFEWKLFGNWKDYDQFTALNDKKPLLVLGAGLDYTDAGAAGALTHVLDVQYDLPEGTSIYAAYLGRYTTDNGGSPTTNGSPTTPGAARSNTYDSTVRVMVAQLIHNHFEPFLRYEYLSFDPADVPSDTNPRVNDITVGANYYFYGHRAKLSGAASYLPNGSPVANTISDLIASHRGAELIVQIQFQLMI